MVANNRSCDLTSLKRFLEHQLDDAEIDALESHLGRCELCRKELENLAAAPEFWMGVGQKLKIPLEDFGKRKTEEAISQLTKTQHSSKSSSEEDRPTSTAAVNAQIRQWLSPSDDPDSIGRLGGYEIVGIVGVGGMSVVLKGYDHSLNRYVAIKVLGTHLAASGAARTRFAREAQAAAAVVHENVLAIHAIDESMDLPYLVMPYVRGESLEKRIEREGQLEVVEVLRIGHQIASGLAAAHAQGLVHRDIKPANILLDEGSERLKIADFGLARAADDASLTHSGSITGTPLYMSPEQARGENVDQRSDQFSFGSLMYTLCTGHAPFRAETPYGIIRRICDDQPRPIRQSNPAVPDWMVTIIDKMMSKKAGERFGSAEELAELFMDGLTHVQHPGTPELSAVLKQYVPARRRWPGPAILLPVVAVAAVVTLAWVAFASPFGASPPEEEVVRNEGDPVGQVEPAPETIKVPVPAGLEYEFSKDQVLNYSCALKIKQPDYDVVVDGLVSLNVVDVNDQHTELEYELTLIAKLNRKEVDHSILPSMLYHFRENERDELVRICKPRGRIFVNRNGRVTEQDTASQFPGELGPLFEFVFPLVSTTTDQPWSRETVVEATIYRESQDETGINSHLYRPARIATPTYRPRTLHTIDPLDPFGRRDGPEAVLFARIVNYQLDSNQDPGDRLKMIKIDGSDKPDRNSRANGIGVRKTTGWFQFDSASGRMVQLKVQREAHDPDWGSIYTHPEVELAFGWLEPEDASELKDTLNKRLGRSLDK